MHSASGPQPVFIDFEGIDGSGKTTLSNRLAEFLKKQGITVHHARDGGVFRSEISRAIREMTRDPRFLRMTDVTELLLYVARDAQMIDEYIRPKLLPGHIVFSDRYLYSTVTHSHHARGLDRAQVQAVLDLAAGGLWPDLVVYCDVDPLTSRIRKKIQKVREGRLGDFGRKGLMGIGFREQMREGFLQLASEDPDRWLVIDNAGSTIEESLSRIYHRVKAILEKKGFGEVALPPGSQPAMPVDEGGERSAGAIRAGATTVAARSSPLAQGVAKLFDLPEEARRGASAPLFFAELDRLVAGRSGYAALFLVGLEHPEATRMRNQLRDVEPSLIAYGLRGLSSDIALQMRRDLLEKQPVYVARSLSGMSLNPGAIALRREQAQRAVEIADRGEPIGERVAQQLALAIKGNDTRDAWELREMLRKLAPDEVLMSLRGIDTPEAWAFREKKSKDKHFPALLESLGGIDSDVAWAWRDKLADQYLPWVLMSLRGVLSERSWRWREEHIGRAPKIIIKTIGRLDEPRAWKLREHAMLLAKEVLDSISGLDSARAWSFRTALRDKWPNTTVSSLGAGNQSERAWNFRWEQLRRNPDNLLLLKHIVKAAIRKDQDIDDEDEDSDDDLG